jgi:hypothetical protein
LPDPNCYFRGMHACVPDIDHVTRKKPVGGRPVGSVIVRYGPGLPLFAETRLLPPIRTILDPVRRVRDHQTRLDSAQNVSDIIGIGGIATQNPVGTAPPQVAQPGDGFGGKLGDLIRSFFQVRIRGEQRIDFRRVEACEAEIQVQILQFEQLETQKIEIPVGLFVTAIIEQPVSADLCRREIVGHVYWRLLES